MICEHQKEKKIVKVKTIVEKKQCLTKVKVIVEMSK